MTRNELDYTIIQLDRPPVSSTPLTMNRASIRPGSTAMIIHHRRGYYKTIGRHRIDSADDLVVRYAIPTEPGSSGAPVIDEHGNLIALHYGRTAGIRINAIIDDLQKNS